MGNPLLRVCSSVTWRLVSQEITEPSEQFDRLAESMYWQHASPEPTDPSYARLPEHVKETYRGLLRAVLGSLTPQLESGDYEKRSLDTLVGEGGRDPYDGFDQSD